MEILILSSFAFLLYVSVSCVQGSSLARGWRHSRQWTFIFALSAVCLHGMVLLQRINMSGEQLLVGFNLLSLMTCLASIFVLVIWLIKPVELLSVIVFPLAACSLFLIETFPGRNFTTMTIPADTIFHILLSVLTIGVLCIAGILAVLLALQERLLHYHQVGGWLTQKVPPLESMENLLFRVVGFGFLLLSAVIATSFYFYSAILLTVPSVFQKIILVLSSWVIFAILLMGRHIKGWRGKKAIYGTLSGVVLLMSVYFFS